MKKISLALLTLGLTSIATSALAGPAVFCHDIQINHYKLEQIATDVINSKQQGGLKLPGWATLVDTTGQVCQVVSTARKSIRAGNDQWLGSRIISAQKAYTANAFSLDGLAISTGALYAATQPGGSLYGLQHSNPLDASTAYKASPWGYGTNWDQLRGKRIGGINVFGGGLALYDDNGIKIGAIGVSGDTSCTDHANAWKIREALGMAPKEGTNTVEVLNLTSTYAALGDHPSCGDEAGVLGSDLGFK